MSDDHGLKAKEEGSKHVLKTTTHEDDTPSSSTHPSSDSPLMTTREMDKGNESPYMDIFKDDSSFDLSSSSSQPSTQSITPKKSDNEGVLNTKDKDGPMGDLLRSMRMAEKEDEKQRAERVISPTVG